MRSIEELAVGKALFPLTHFLFNRRGILPLHRSLLRAERLPPELIRAAQDERLRRLVAYCERWIPFYQQRFREAGLAARDIRTLDDLRALPPLTRQEVIERHHEMVDARVRDSALLADRSGRGAGSPLPFAPFRRHRLVRNTSSGSTGAPTVFYEDGSRSAVNWAHELRVRSWFGVPPGAREARLARISSDFLPRGRELRMRRGCWNQLVLPGVNLTDREFAYSAEKLAEFRPRVLWGFTSALTGLASHLLERGLPAPCRPEVIIAWAAPLYPHEEALLRKAFAAPVTNLYGAREVGHIAARCPEGSFHINQESIHLESEPVPGSLPDEPGELLATTLDVTVMPFLRYRMGDLGRVVPSACSCGRSLAVLADLLGRTGEVFRARDGRLISPNFWCRTFMNPALAGKVARFQVVYRGDSEIRVRIVRGPGFTSETGRELLAFLTMSFAGGCLVALEFPDEILPQLSGKYQMVVKEPSP
jgi:phenylacetate-CoA ligase